MSAIAAIVLAAGESRRMGTMNKLLLPIAGVPLLRRVIETLSASPLQEIVVVVGHEHEQLEPLLDGLDVRRTINANYQTGQMSSVHAGLAALRSVCDGVMVCLGDQPLLTSEDVVRLIEAFGDIGTRSILVPTYRRRRGNPVIVSYAHRAQILSGGRQLGCRHLIDRNPGLVATLEMDTDHVIVDLDTQEDYHAIQKRLGAAPAVTNTALLT